MCLNAFKHMSRKSLENDMIIYLYIYIYIYRDIAIAKMVACNGNTFQVTAGSPSQRDGDVGFDGFLCRPKETVE